MGKIFPHSQCARSKDRRLLLVPKRRGQAFGQIKRHGTQVHAGPAAFPVPGKIAHKGVVCAQEQRYQLLYCTQFAAQPLGQCFGPRLQNFTDCFIQMPERRGCCLCLLQRYCPLCFRFRRHKCREEFTDDGSKFLRAQPAMTSCQQFFTGEQL